MTDLAKEIARTNFQKGGRRPCVLCRRDFDAEGMQTICDTCARNAPIQSRPPPPLHQSWPARALAEVDKLQGVAVNKARSVVDLVLGDSTIAIIGDRGRGKTVMACWFARERQRRGKSSGLYTRAHDLFALIRRAWHPQSKDDEWTVLERFRNTPFLVIDEFQERSESEWENRTLANILDHRHADMRPSVIIANLSREEFGRQIGPSILDRISQTGGIVECTWGNLRNAPTNADFSGGNPSAARTGSHSYP